MAKPYKARADFAGAEAMLTALSSAQMQKIVSSDAKDLRTYGLDKPDVTVTVTSGSTRAALALGKKDGESVYARDVSRPLVFTIPATTAADLEKDATTLRLYDPLTGKEIWRVSYADGFSNVGAQFIPSVALGEDAFGQALGGKTAVGLLRDHGDGAGLAGLDGRRRADQGRRETTAWSPPSAP